MARLDLHVLFIVERGTTVSRAERWITYQSSVTGTSDGSSPVATPTAQPTQGQVSSLFSSSLMITDNTRHMSLMIGTTRERSGVVGVGRDGKGV